MRSSSTLKVLNVILTLAAINDIYFIWFMVLALAIHISYIYCILFHKALLCISPSFLSIFIKLNHTGSEGVYIKLFLFTGFQFSIQLLHLRIRCICKAKARREIDKEDRQQDLYCSNPHGWPVLRNHWELALIYCRIESWLIIKASVGIHR